MGTSHIFKLVLLTAFFSCSDYLSVAQKKGFYHIGMGGGITSAWILPQNNARTLEDYPDIAKSELAYALKFGYQFGALAGYNFSKNYGIQLRLIYEKTGQNYEDNFLPNAGPLHVVRKIGLDYIALPVLFRYTSNKATRVKAYLLAGLQFNFLMNAEEKVYLNKTLKTDSLKAMNKFNHFDFGLAIGAGADIFLIKNIYMTIGLYNYLGITDINSDAVKNFISKNDSDYVGSKNFRGGIQVGLHYLFKMKNKNPWEN
jgi:opacity protein-like surface antigen